MNLHFDWEVFRIQGIVKMQGLHHNNHFYGMLTYKSWVQITYRYEEFVSPILINLQKSEIHLNLEYEKNEFRESVQIFNEVLGKPLGYNLWKNYPDLG